MNICEEASTVFGSVQLNVVLSMVLLINGVAIFLITLTVVAIMGATTLHLHLRILFVHLALVLLFRTGCTTYRAMSMLLNPVLATTPCDLVYSLISCKMFSEISKSGLDVMMYSFVPISLERLLASLKYAQYERWRSPVVCVLCGIIIPWLPAVYEFYEVFTSLPNDGPIPYCSSLSSSTHNFVHLTQIHLPLCLICVFLSSGAIFISIRRRRTLDARNLQNSLSGRYQLLENIRMTKLILPNIFAYSLTLSIHIGALIYVGNAVYPSTAEFAIAKEWTSFVIPLYANFYPLAFILGSPEVAKRILPSIFPRLTRTRRVAPLGTASDYFHQYDASWR